MNMKRIVLALLASVLLLAGCATQEGDASSAGSSQSPPPSQQEDSSSEPQPPEGPAIPGSYTVPEGWVKWDAYSNHMQLFYVQEGHEADRQPDNISIHVGKNRYSLEEHEQFRAAIVQQLMMQLKGAAAELNGDGTYTEQGDLLYIFTITADDIVTIQYYILRDHGFCLVQLTNFSGSETAEQAARSMVDSFVWEAEG